ncbi:regulator of G- signaling loco-like isoform X1 [Brachionus plicatilis]|uniref:Regulator of G-signaling loco-like isoform X1 n=1 Tax=Brachionus plicatilis TaxID=10195 RepID=A0A3M7PVZ8_BRAPC|nr:regulator of G- signaling loco-like isoform X1 [Brachionus plicatilis]
MITRIFKSKQTLLFTLRPVYPIFSLNVLDYHGKEFLKKEFSEENIDFWVKCENFKKLSDVEEMKAEASNIWQTYLDTSSMCQINVDNKARSSCQDALLTPYNTMFELAQTQIFTLMKYDSYSRFLKSLMYKDCIVNEMEGKTILSALNGNKSKKPETIISVNSPSNNDNSEIVDDNQTNQSSIPNASSNLATAVAVVASTGAALITNVTVSNSTQVNDPLSSTNLTITSNSNSLPNDPNRKEKKRSTIIPWTKAVIFYVRLCVLLNYFYVLLKVFVNCSCFLGHIPL